MKPNRPLILLAAVASLGLSVPPAHAASALMTPAYHRQRAEDSIDKHDWNAAAQELRQTLALDSRDAGSRVKLGYVYLKLGQNEQAGREFRAALKCRPHLASAERGLDETFSSQDQRDAYLAEVTRDARQHPNDADQQISLASLLLNRGDVGGAREYALKALAIAPNSGAAHSVMGRIELARNDLDNAASDLRCAVKADRGDEYAWEGLAKLAAERNDPSQAAYFRKRAIATAEGF